MNINWREIGFICIAGGIGGILSLVYTVTVGNTPYIPPSFLGVFAYIFFGMAAGYLGVYVIARTDTTKMAHALGFALACGLSWAPVIDASGALVQQHIEQALGQQVEQANETIETALAEIPDAEGDRLVQLKRTIEENTQVLAEAAVRADSLKTVRKVNDSIATVEAAVNRMSEKDAEVAVNLTDKVNTILERADYRLPVQLYAPRELIQPERTPERPLGEARPDARREPAPESAPAPERLTQPDRRLIQPRPFLERPVLPSRE